MKDLGTLRETVQVLRARQFAHLPEQLVDTVLDIEADNLGDRGRSRGLVIRAVTDYLQSGDAS